MAERDYLTEMRAIIDAEMQPGDAAPIVAARIVEKLRVNDPDLLQGILDLNAANTIRNIIHTVIGSARGHARAMSRSDEFYQRVVEGGDVAGWLSDAVTYPVDASGAQLPLRLMSAVQVRFAADSRDSAAVALKMESAFLRAVAKKVPAGKTVGDVFDESRIIQLRRSITGQAA